MGARINKCMMCREIGDDVKGAGTAPLLPAEEERGGHKKIRRRGELEVPGIAGDDPDGVTFRLDEPGLVGSLPATATGGGEDVQEETPPEELGRLHRPEAGTVERF